MYYYEVAPASKSFHGKEPLTYCYKKKLAPGQIARLKLRNSASLGIVIKEVNKPAFDTVEIEDALDKLIIPKSQLSLMRWMVEFYPSSIGATAQLFAPSILEKLERGDPLPNKDKLQDIPMPKLTKEQSDAYRLITGDTSTDHRSYILHGVTGSGKTRLYIELAKDNVSKNKSVIVLTPEISLTTPLASQFKKVFKDIVEINHSSLTPKQKLTLWDRAFYSKQPVILIGPRSSLFFPVNNIGLIVVDEFHEPAYKQESQPFYHANRTASMLSKLSSAKLVFGSATPPVIDYYLAKQKNAMIVKMDHSAITAKKPSGRSIIVNLLDNNENSGYPLISKTLISHISEVLSRKEQAMVFINKRGSARLISCQDCGNKEVCKNCDLPMVYHGDQHLIRCHTCGFSKEPPTKCVACGSSNIYFSSPGTKAIAENLAKIFPKAKIARFDKDNKKAERLENIYDQAVDHIDIIVGTQTVAKGHDLPRLSLVAMLLADNGLDFPDYSSEERSYQLIKQLSGRINRGHREGIFIVQSFNPASKFIRSGISGSWDDFYEEEIAQRAKHGFPPFYSALKVEAARKSAKSAEQSLDKLIDKLKLDNKNLEILGPSPSFVEKKSSLWHWQMIIKSKNRSALAEIARSIPSSFRVDIDPNNFL